MKRVFTISPGYTIVKSQRWNKLKGWKGFYAYKLYLKSRGEKLSG